MRPGSETLPMEPDEAEGSDPHPIALTEPKKRPAWPAPAISGGPEDSGAAGVAVAYLMHHMGPDALDLLQPGEAVKRRSSPGGAGPQPVARQMEEARVRLAEQRSWLDVDEPHTR
jgi:hypothetical protein